MTVAAPMPDPELNEFETVCLKEWLPPALIQAIASLRRRLTLDLCPAIAIVYRRAEAWGLCTSARCDACAVGHVPPHHVPPHHAPARSDGRPGPACTEGRWYFFPEPGAPAPQEAR